jgi:hypothetical protein
MKTKFFTLSSFVWLLSFCTYFTLGFLFASHSKLVFHQHYICDLYYGFDNAFHTTSFFRHPLLRIFSEILKLIFGGENQKFISILLVIICSILLSFQNYFIYNILNKIISLSKHISLFITFCSGLFGGNLLLSFTFDSYVFSTCFLSMFFFYFLKSEKEPTPLNSYWLFILSLLLSGTTVAHFAKLILVTSWSTFREKYYKIIVLVLGLILTSYLLFYDKVKESLLFISTHSNVKKDYLRNLIDYFLGSSFLIPNPHIGNVNYIDGSRFNVIVGKHFTIAEVIILILWIVCLIFIIVNNFSNKNIQFLMLLFFVDVFIHRVFGLGFQEAYIFFGNYSFIWPIIIGIGYQSLRSKFEKNFFIFCLILFSVLFLVLNIQTLFTLYHFGANYYSID